MAKKNITAAEGSDFKGGIRRPRAISGKIDPEKTRIAKYATGGSGFGMGRERTAGMMLDFIHMSAPYSSGYKLDTYRSSYAFGLGDRTGAYDIPTYFIMMNQQNGGLLYWPVTLAEKYSWYRYWCYYLDDKHLAQVLMFDGTLKSIKDVEVGDEVITGIGTIRRVSEKIERHCNDPKAVEIDVWCLQNSTLVTHEHPFYILRKSQVKKDETHYRDQIDFTPEWINADRVEPGDYVLMAPYKPGKISDLTPEQTAFLGYYASEGSIVWGMRCVGTAGDNGDEKANGWKWHQEKVKVPIGVSFTLNKDEEETVGRRIIELSKSVFGVEGKIVRRRENHIEILASGRNVGEFCHLHVGYGSIEKKLSKEMLDATTEAKKAFLLAFAEGDGHQYNDDKNNGKILIATASNSLASQVQVIAISAGIMCRIAKYERKNDKWSDTPIWHITIPSWSADSFVSDSSKWIESDSIGHQHCALFVNGYAAFKVEKVAYCEKDDTVYNLELEAHGDEKSFQCNGMVSHNCRSDAYVGRAMELLSDLPMSKLTLNMPKMPKNKKALGAEILEFFTYQMDVLNLFELCQSILWEWNSIGNCYVFHEWSDEKKMWTRAVMLPPEEVYIFQYPFSDNKRVEYRPERLIRMIRDGSTVVAGMSSVSAAEGNVCMRADLEQKILEHLPNEIVDMVRTEGCIVMDTDPMTGSFVHHFARRRSPYLDLGASVLERVLVQMLTKEHYRYTQLSLASRNMTPKNVITAPGLMPDEVDVLRTQVDLSYMDPEYSVITNYDVNWQQIGTTDRLLDLDREYERIENQIFAGLGVTRELLTGESTFTGSKITVEILNTMFLMTRELLKGYIEKKLFIPICEAHGWYEEGKNGIKKYWCPQIGFNRLTIRDNAEVFDSLFQLYQKGSLPVDIIYELFNLNVDEINTKLRNQLFTVKDATSNRLSEEVNAEVGRKLVDTTDIVARVARYLGLKMKAPDQSSGGMPGASGLEQGFVDLEGEPGQSPTGPFESEAVIEPEDKSEETTEEQPSESSTGEAKKTPEELDKLAEAVKDALPSGADEEDISKVVDKVSDLE